MASTSPELTTLLLPLRHARLDSPVSGDGERTSDVAHTLASLLNPLRCPIADNLLKLTQEELAQLVGMSRQVTNNALLRLQAEGVLAIEHGGIAIVDVRAIGPSGGSLRSVGRQGSMNAEGRSTTSSFLRV